MEKFKKEVLGIENESILEEFIQKKFFSGIPLIFKGRDDEHYSFRKKIADNFKIDFQNINIVGSARFGFSPYKFTKFSYESDIDVAIFNNELFEHYYDLVSSYNYRMKSKDILLNNTQYKLYIRFIKYFSSGWMRPDLLPQNTKEFKEIRVEWDNFFNSISYNKSEVGNYSVKAGLFKERLYAEKYYKYTITQLQRKLIF